VIIVIRSLVFDILVAIYSSKTCVLFITSFSANYHAYHNYYHAHFGGGCKCLGNSIPFSDCQRRSFRNSSSSRIGGSERRRSHWYNSPQQDCVSIIIWWYPFDCQLTRYRNIVFHCSTTKMLQSLRVVAE
jgi:hypothetical protein